MAMPSCRWSIWGAGSLGRACPTLTAQCRGLCRTRARETLSWQRTAFELRWCPQGNSEESAHFFHVSVQTVVDAETPAGGRCSVGLRPVGPGR